MKTHRFLASVAVASVLASASPAYAQVLGGGGLSGAVNGAMNGTLSGGPNGIGGIGHRHRLSHRFDRWPDRRDSIALVTGPRGTADAAADRAHTASGKARDKAQSTAGQARDKTTSTVDEARNVSGSVAGSVSSTANGAANLANGADSAANGTGNAAASGSILKDVDAQTPDSTGTPNDSDSDRGLSLGGALDASGGGQGGLVTDSAAANASADGNSSTAGNARVNRSGADASVQHADSANADASPSR